MNHEPGTCTDPFCHCHTFAAVKRASEQAELRRIYAEWYGREYKRVLLERVLALRAKKARETAYKGHPASAPTTQHERAARFALAVGVEILHLRHLGHLPVVEWRHLPPLDGYRRMGRTSSRFADLKAGTAEIVLADDLSVAEVVETSLHELRHVYDDDWTHRGSAVGARASSEAEAVKFHETWTHPVLRCGLAVKWDQDRVRIVDQTRPPHRKSKGDEEGMVAISRGSPGNVFRCGRDRWDFLGGYT